MMKRKIVALLLIMSMVLPIGSTPINTQASVSSHGELVKTKWLQKQAKEALGIEEQSWGFGEVRKVSTNLRPGRYIFYADIVDGTFFSSSVGYQAYKVENGKKVYGFVSTTHGKSSISDFFESTKKSNGKWTGVNRLGFVKSGDMKNSKHVDACFVRWIGQNSTCSIWLAYDGLIDGSGGKVVPESPRSSCLKIKNGLAVPSNLKNSKLIKCGGRTGATMGKTDGKYYSFGSGDHEYWRIHARCDGGDSGGIVVTSTEGDNRPVGIVTGVSRGIYTYTYITLRTDIEKEMQVYNY